MVRLLGKIQKGRACLSMTGLRDNYLEIMSQTNSSGTSTTIEASATNSTLVGFIVEPSARGTLSLLYSCSGILLICIWGALYLNLPKPNETIGQRVWRYLRWVLVALFAPELLIWVAWRQLNSATQLTRVVSRLAVCSIDNAPQSCDRARLEI